MLTILFGLLSVVWFLVCFWVWKQLSFSDGPDANSLKQVGRVNLFSMPMGLVAGMCGVAAPVFGLVDVFNGLANVEPEQKTFFLQENIVRVMEGSAVFAAFGLAIFLSAIIVFFVERSRVRGKMALADQASG